MTLTNKLELGVRAVEEGVRLFCWVDRELGEERESGSQPSFYTSICQLGPWGNPRKPTFFLS